MSALSSIALGIALLLVCATIIAAALWTIGEVIDRWNTKREKAHQEFIAHCAAAAALHKAQRDFAE